jgi:hypothetical protein
MYSTHFGLYLGHHQSCQYKKPYGGKYNRIESKGPCFYSLYFLIILNYNIKNIQCNVQALNNFLKCVYEDVYEFEVFVFSNKSSK